MSTTPSSPPIPNDPAAIQAAIEQRQRRLAGTVDELTTRLRPREIARRTVGSAQQRAQQAVTAEDGSLRSERIVAVAAAVVGILALVVARRVRR